RENRYGAGIGGPEAAVVMTGSKREPCHIYDTSLYGPAWHAKIARIFPEDMASACFNCISCDDDGLAHSIAINKPSSVARSLLADQQPFRWRRRKSRPPDRRGRSCW